MSADCIEVAVPVPVFGTFTYVVPDNRAREAVEGVRVTVPFGRGRVVGVIVERHRRPTQASLKEAGRILDSSPILSKQLLELGMWISQYYFAPPGEVLRGMLPPGLLARKVPGRGNDVLWPSRKLLAVVAVLKQPEHLTPRQHQAFSRLHGRTFPVIAQAFVRETGIGINILRALETKGAIRLETVEVLRSPWRATAPDLGYTRHVLTPDQDQVLREILGMLDRKSFETCLVHGVTGSGKTELYLHAIEYVLAQGKSALMMVPEIGLTPQVAGQFRARFGDLVAIQHSALSDGERFDQWRSIQAGRCQVVIGTRSAVYAPLSKLGLIIVDEEQDGSYKQEEMPRYHGRDTAIKRAQLEGSLVVLGSATPQLETYFQAVEKRRYAYHVLPSRILERPLPTVHVVDMRSEFEKHGREALISGFLQQLIGQRMDTGQQVLILLNRRGYAPFVICRRCGRVETCGNCSISLTYHRSIERLTCHYCGYSRSVPNQCPECRKEFIYFAGAGTEKIQAELLRIFPSARIGRFDRDSTQRKGSHQRILQAFAQGKTDILVGTQMIAKGHDFPNVTLVGVLAADLSLKLADFRAAERTFQLLTQVAGRAGRGEVPGEVVIQTYYPNHYSLKYACAQDYRLFYAKEIDFRRNFRYPPFTSLANILVSGSQEGEVRSLAASVAEKLTEARSARSHPRRMRILGPAPAPLERLKRDYRYQILLKTTSRMELNDVLRVAVQGLSSKEMRRLSIDIDPVNLL